MNVLISGASIAGPTLAHFLLRAGCAVTVVERGASPRLRRVSRPAATRSCGSISALAWIRRNTHGGVRMERWSTARIILCGDAGYCPSPFSGQGTSLALIGAFVLARELGARPASGGRLRPP